jgi:hypothetical protein
VTHETVANRDGQDPHVPPPTPGVRGEEPPARSALMDAVGGRRGVLDSGLPVVVFLTANALFGLETAVWVAVGCGVAICLLRLVRRETLQQAIGGFLALALAAFIARRTGTAEGFFYTSVAKNVAWLAGLLISIAVRRPLIGIIVAAVEGGGSAWRNDPVLRRAYTIATWGWAGVFALRASVQGFLLTLEGDQGNALGVANLVLGYPLFFLAVGLTVAYLRRTTRGRVTAEAAAAAEEKRASTARDS